MDEQKRLLQIVKKWNFEEGYRGFRCADCQKYMHKAWHHFLDYGGFKTPVHFCNKCQKKFGSSKGEHKIFTCDKCGKNHFKMFHIWKRKDKLMEEIHLCKKCYLNSTKVH